MRKLIGIIAAVIAVSFLSGGSFAENQEVSITVGANMTDILELDYSLWEIPENQDIFEKIAIGEEKGTKEVTNGTMNFGTLVETPIDVNKDSIPDTIIYLPDYYFCVMLYPSSSGRAYTVTQQVTNASSALKRALVATPAYEPKDLWWPGGPKQGAKPADADVKKPIWAAYEDTAKDIYYSGSEGKGRIVRCIYGFATGNNELGLKHPVTGKDLPVDPDLPAGVPYTPDDTSDDVVGPITKDFGGNFDATVIFTLTL